MNAAQQLSEALIELERIQKTMAGLSMETGEEWKRDLIALRRRLQAQINLVGEAAERCDALRRGEGSGRSFWDGLARMRSAVALHQANWPAVAISPNDPKYQQSIANVRTANRAFVALAQEILPTLTPRPQGP
jgi:hypothetical protein